jgi:hypothetical protein
MIKPDFHFSQSSLQDFEDCPRRFQLRYLKDLSWPAVETEPLLEKEMHMRRGSRFHLLVQQHLSGVSASEIRNSISDPILLNWWDQYLRYGPDLSGWSVLSEQVLTASIQKHKLAAKFDVIAHRPGGETLIIDWKTSLQKPSRKWLRGRMQTLVYPYVLTAASPDQPFGEPTLDPDTIKMMYWFPADPETPEIFSYSKSKFTDEAHHLEKKISHIISQASGPSDQVLPLTNDHTQCKFCGYRSLCDRGQKSGKFNNLHDLSEAKLKNHVFYIK